MAAHVTHSPLMRTGVAVGMRVSSRGPDCKHRMQLFSAKIWTVGKAREVKRFARRAR